MSRHTFWQRLVAVLGVALLVAVVGSRSPDVFADPKGFVFTPLAFLGTPTPGGEQFLNTFDSSRINNRGDVQFSSSVTTEGDEGREFLLIKGEITEIPIRAGEPAPGGGVFAPFSLSPSTLNDRGEVGLVYVLDPFVFPEEGGPSAGVNAGVYRFSPSIHTIVTVMTPGVTPAPGGGLFVGAGFGANLNNRGDLVFAGIVPTDKGFPLPDESGLGVGLFKADKKGQLSSLVSPGDSVPGGGVFDWTNGPWINDRGDVAFMGHVAGEECRPSEGLPPPNVLIACLSGVYVKPAATDDIRSIAHAGEPAPGGGIYRQAFSPVINNRGDVVFFGDLTSPPAARQVTGVYLHSAGETIQVAGPGDEMPGEGHFVTASNILGWQLHMNNAGEVVFNATLDTTTLSTDEGDPIPDTGLYVWSHGSLRLVSRTGTVIPGVGTIAQLVMNVLRVAPPAVFVPNSGAHNNDRGQVVFAARLVERDEHGEQRGVLLVATPKSHKHKRED
jgi:hypothetical protein